MAISKRQSGYTLLFSVLTAALVLGVAVFITSVARKQYILSSTALGSLYSFYSADSGIECVALNPSVFGTTTSQTISCGGASTGTTFTYSHVSFMYGLNTYPASEGVFSLGFFSPGPNSQLWGCAVITIDQFKDNQGYDHRLIQSRGYNLCIPSGLSDRPYLPDGQSPRITERGLRLDYIQ